MSESPSVVPVCIPVPASHVPTPAPTIPEIPTPAPTTPQCSSEIFQESDTVDGLIERICGADSGSCQEGGFPHAVFEGTTCPSDLALKSGDQILICCAIPDIETEAHNNNEEEEAEEEEETDKTYNAATSSAGASGAVAGIVVGSIAAVLAIAAVAVYIRQKKQSQEPLATPAESMI